MAVTIDGCTWPAEEEAHVRPLALLPSQTSSVCILCESAKHGAIMAQILLPTSVISWVHHLVQHRLHVMCKDLSTAQKHSPEQVLNLSKTDVQSAPTTIGWTCSRPGATTGP